VTETWRDIKLTRGSVRYYRNEKNSREFKEIFGGLVPPEEGGYLQSKFPNVFGGGLGTWCSTTMQHVLYMAVRKGDDLAVVAEQLLKVAPVMEVVSFPIVDGSSWEDGVPNLSKEGDTWHIWMMVYSKRQPNLCSGTLEQCLRYIKENVALPDPIKACRVCGCTDDRACMTTAGPCYWVEDDLCSACSEKVPRKVE
jgi:hypothetical protein